MHEQRSSKGNHHWRTAGNQSLHACKAFPASNSILPIYKHSTLRLAVFFFVGGRGRGIFQVKGTSRQLSRGIQRSGLSTLGAHNSRGTQLSGHSTLRAHNSTLGAHNSTLGALVYSISRARYGYIHTPFRHADRRQQPQNSPNAICSPQHPYLRLR